MGIHPGLQILFLFGSLLIAVVFHEFAHGYVAYKLGDSTAKDAGRLTLNPLKHIDPIGMIVVPLLLVLFRFPFVIGWAKPVPVNFYNLHNPKRDMIWVGLAGPVTNFTMACLGSVLLQADLIASSAILATFIGSLIVINIVLGVFNCIPIPPLDGSRVVTGLLPRKYAYYYAQLEPYGFPILILLLWVGLIGRVILPIVLFIAKLLGVAKLLGLPL